MSGEKRTDSMATPGPAPSVAPTHFQIGKPIAGLSEWAAARAQALADTVEGVVERVKPSKPLAPLGALFMRAHIETEVAGAPLDVDAIVPSFVASHGAIEVRAGTAAAELVDEHVLDALLDGTPATEMLEPLSDSEMIEIAVREATEAIVAFRDTVLLQVGHNGPSERYARAVHELARAVVQDFLIPHTHAADVVRAALARPRDVHPDYPAAVPRLPRVDGLEVLAELYATDPTQWRWRGKSSEAIRGRVLEGRAKAKADADAQAAEATRLAQITKTSPRAAGLFVLRRLADEARERAGIRRNAYARPVSIRNGYEYACFARALPRAIDHGRLVVTTALTMGGAEHAFELVPDDEVLELSNFDLERRSAPPLRVVMDAVFASLRSRITKREPVVSFVDARDRFELRARMKKWKPIVEALSSVFTNADPYVAPHYRAIIMQTAIVGLRISPLVVAAELAKLGAGDGWATNVHERARDGHAIARDPSVWIFGVDSLVDAAKEK